MDGFYPWANAAPQRAQVAAELGEGPHEPLVARPRRRPVRDGEQARVIAALKDIVR